MELVTAAASDMAGCVCVPTMGALHEGHLALIRAARGWARQPHAQRDGPPRVVATVFVNPTQFNDPRDFERYPRNLERDAQLAEEAGADVLFAPPVEVVYPPDLEAPTPALPAVATQAGLEDRFRPGHFAGVAQVVARLFSLLRPRAAVFGEKDWQQLLLVRELSRRQGWGVEILSHPTVREADGLAAASRNALLTPQQRTRARAVPRALVAATRKRCAGEAERTLRAALEEGGLEVEYAVLRDAATLQPLPAEAEREAVEARLLVAVRLEQVRLIDNAPWRLDEELAQLAGAG